jgi:quercetin dioxygenase-like cupin family protein
MKLNMEQEILVKHVESSKIEWQPLIEDDVNTKGIFVKILRYDEAAKRAPVILLKFEPGAKYPAHNHPAGEEVFVLEGEVKFGNMHLLEGDYLYTPPNGKHAVWSKNGCIMLLNIPEEVEILKSNKF